MLSGWNFSDALAAAVKEKGSFLIGGLDPQLRYLPPYIIKDAYRHYGHTFEAVGRSFFAFNRNVIDAIHKFVPAVKPQMAFYEEYGHWGVWAFEQTVAYARSMGLVVIEDAKRSDGGDTADAYADGHLGQVSFLGCEDPADLWQCESPIRVDCMTVMPYIGEDCVCRFVNRAVKKYGTGIFVVTKTSFRPNSAVEQLKTCLSDGTSYLPVWTRVASMVSEWGEGTEGSCGLRNVGVVMGATYPDDAVIMRDLLPNVWFLVPGYGGQGATAEDSVTGLRKDGLGIVVNNSRGLIYSFRDLKNKEHGFPMICEDGKCFNLVGQKAEKCRDELVAAARAAGKWPFGQSA